MSAGLGQSRVRIVIIRHTDDECEPDRCVCNAKSWEFPEPEGTDLTGRRPPMEEKP